MGVVSLSLSSQSSEPSLFLEGLRLRPHDFLITDMVIILSGADAKEYLQSQTTNDVNKLSDNSFQFNSILEVSGKIISSFILCQKSSVEFYLLLKKDFLAPTYERIEKYHISEDFEVEQLAKIGKLSVNSNPTNVGFRGQYFFENDSIELVDGLFDTKADDSFNLLKILTGVPELGCEVKPGTLINNTRFDELSVDYNKGCYPGQETVSKIHTRKGAAYKSILMISDGNYGGILGPVTHRDKKIGNIIASAEVGSKTYLNISILREFRIDKSVLDIQCETSRLKGRLHYYPYLSPYESDLAVELYDLAVELFLAGKNENAIKYFQLAILKKPDFEDAYESLGVLYGRLGNFEKAIELMEKLRAINSKCMMALTNLSLYHMKLGHIEIAEQFKGDATLLNFELLGDAAEKKRKAEELEIKKISEQARREGMFKQVIDMDPDDAMANNGMGEIELERDNYFQAEGHFRTAIKSNPKYSIAFLGLSKSLIAQTKLADAKLALSEGMLVAGKNGDLMPANEMQTLYSKIENS